MWKLYALKVDPGDGGGGRGFGVCVWGRGGGYRGMLYRLSEWVSFEPVAWIYDLKKVRKEFVSFLHPVSHNGCIRAK